MHFQFSDSDQDENNDSVQQSDELSDHQISPSDSEPTESELSESESLTEAMSGSPMTSQSEMSHRLDSQMTEDKVTAESDYSSDRMDSRLDSRSRSRSNTASMSDQYHSQSQISESQISENESGTDFTQT